MADYGFVTYTQSGVEGFNLSTRITKKVLDLTVEADSSGSMTVSVPDNLAVAITVIQLDGDSHMRHYPHRVTFDASTNLLTYQPGVNPDPKLDGFAEWSIPKRSRSAIIIYGFVPG